MTSSSLRLLSLFVISIGTTVSFNFLSYDTESIDRKFNTSAGIYMCNRTASEIEATLKKHEVIPDVIKTAPKNLLQVTYFPTPIELGNNMSAKETDVEPSLLYWPADHRSHYTLIMTDPDVPNRTTHFHREWQNWVVVNIPGCDIMEGETLTEYVPPLPEEGFGGVHRFIFLAFKQPRLDMFFNETFVREKDASYGLRANFSTERFAKKYRLGDPVAVNFFFTQWDNIN